jgi:DNA-binding transcriptional regulator YdaS (Cro superfamily)
MDANSPLQRAVDKFGGRSALAARLGVSTEAVRQWLAGVSKVSADRAVQIETATECVVKREELRPDLFCK